ncbi:MAG: tetratricopeptide repeat protein [Gammaproteobacteria bacterium]|nr:tetratricopeptide repeat protein [Gammaproteobacteria bacterium]
MTKQRADAEIARLMQAGDDHIHEGRGSEADRCFRRVLERAPDHAGALHRVGFLALHRGAAREAVDFLGRAMATRGEDALLCGHLASAHLAAGNPDEAIRLWRRALEMAPDYAAAYRCLGDAYYAKGDAESSETAYRKAVALAPNDPRARVGLARVLLFTDRAEEGEAMLRRVLEIAEGASDINNLVGKVLIEAGGLDAALERFEASVRSDPDDVEGYAGKGIALHMLGRPEEAEAAYRAALGAAPRNAFALKHLGILLQERGELDGAADCFRRLVAADPEDDVARHMLAATTGEMTKGAPPGYVTRLFDDYADRFDAHLDRIAYRVPELIRDAVVETAGNDAAGLRVLDLGCGTGRCGQALKPLAAFLAGVDLSPRMIAKSRARSIYDSLAVGSIEEALQGQNRTYDLIVAGDVFIYVGDLAAVMPACARALRPGGLMAFSVEDAEGSGYLLRPTGRYAHSVAYIDELAAKSGLAVEYRRGISVRNDVVPIAGRIEVLAKRE